MHKNSIIDETIDITSETKLTLETPKIKDLIKLNNLDKDSLIKSCIKKITHKGEIYHTNKFLPEQFNELLDNLPMNVLPKVESFLQKQPELYATIETNDGPKEVNGFLNFFTYR